MDSNLWYRNTKARDFRSIPGIAGGSSAGEGDVGGALAPTSSWLSKWQSRYSRLCDWVEENIEETLT
jgi:hypothetical protein